jgi:hypothetical protein
VKSLIIAELEEDTTEKTDETKTESSTVESGPGDQTREKPAENLDPSEDTLKHKVTLTIDNNENIKH